MIIKSVNDALQLPEGRLAINMGFYMQASFSTENVAQAANLIIQNNDETELYTQAGVVARAGNFYNWGLGEEANPGVDAGVYATF